MRLITKEKYVLRFDFLIWSLKVWIWMSVFWFKLFLDIRNFAIMHDTAVFRPKGTGKFPEFFLRVKGDPNDEIDHKRNMFPTIRFFALIPQILNLNVRFLIKLVFRIFEIFAIMHETALFLPKNTGKFPEFILTVRGDPNDEIDHKRKLCSTFDFLIWSLKVWIRAFLLSIS